VGLKEEPIPLFFGELGWVQPMTDRVESRVKSMIFLGGVNTVLFVY